MTYDLDIKEITSLVECGLIQQSYLLPNVKHKLILLENIRFVQVIQTRNVTVVALL
jgi:hypothetical protein